MKRQFSTREKVLLIILALMLVFCIYYILVEKPVRDTLLDASQRQSAAESELTIASAQLNNMYAMEAALDELDQTTQADVPDYDNAINVVQLLNEAMAMTDEYTLSFPPVVKDGAIASRTIEMNFRCGSYAASKAVLKTLLDSDYRCRITSMSVTCDRGDDIRQDEVIVNASVTFYEFLSTEQR